MPDWSYHPLFRPLLFRLPPRIARRLALGAMGRLAAAPGGSLVIRTLGHLEATAESAVEAMGLRFACAIGRSGEVDPDGLADAALAKLGFGFLEIGPVTEAAAARPPVETVDPAAEAIRTSDRFANGGVDAAERRLRAFRRAAPDVPAFVRTRHGAADDPAAAAMAHRRLAERLAPLASALVVDAFDDRFAPEEQLRTLERVRSLVREAAPQKPLLLYVPPDLPDERLDAVVEALRNGAGGAIDPFADALRNGANGKGAFGARSSAESDESGDSSVGGSGVDGSGGSGAAGSGWSGVVVGGAMPDGDGWTFGAAVKDAAHRAVRRLREALPPPFTIVAAGGVREPIDAVEMRRAGADLIQLDAGLVFSGPGLAKRANDALVYETIRRAPSPPEPAFWRQWGWMALLGVAMMAGGAIAWAVAATTVVLPYDLRFLGMDRAAIEAANERLLPFMSHDRITLAGTMISIGVLYYHLARHGLRRRLHWARTALLTSGLVGFSGFFLYLGYGYFDPLHAVASALLLPMFVLSMRDAVDAPSRRKPNLRNSRAWKRALWGQLAFVAVGVGLAAGGLAIAAIGVTRVFVDTDLAFLGTTPDWLRGVSDKLIPLVAHDRAGFGGALLADAIAVLVTALWGIQEGERWIWRMLLLAGLPGFVAGLGVHFAIGYVDFVHLLPVYALLVLYAGGLVALYSYLHARS